jgi:hypothetical protein
MLAQDGEVVHFNLGDGSPDELMQFQPELSGIGLRLGIGSPVVGDVLVLTGDLATVAPVANGNIDSESLHLV